MILPSISTLILSAAIFVALAVTDWYVSRPLNVPLYPLSPEGRRDIEEGDAADLRKVA
jgi:hypothetical protein